MQYFNKNEGKTVTGRHTTEVLAPEWVSYIRKKLTLRQYQLGKLIGVDMKTISRWESGRSTCTGPAAILLMMLGEGDPEVLALCRAKGLLIENTGEDDGA